MQNFAYFLTLNCRVDDSHDARSGAFRNYALCRSAGMGRAGASASAQECLNARLIPHAPPLTPDDFLGLDAAGGVAGIHYQLSSRDNLGKVVLGVIRRDDNTIEFRDTVERDAGHIECIFAPLAR